MNQDNFKKFSELVGKYSPTLKQLSARRVQRDSVEEEISTVAAEVIQRLSPPPMQALLYVRPTGTPPSDSGSSSSDEEPGIGRKRRHATGDTDEEVVEKKLKEEKIRVLEFLHKKGLVTIDLLRAAENILPREEIERRTRKVLLEIDEYGIDLLEVKSGCAVIHLVPNNDESLERFWTDYRSGQLSRNLSKYLITDEMRDVAGQDLMIGVIILEEQYREWKEYFQVRDKPQGVMKMQSLAIATKSELRPESAATKMRAMLQRDKETRQELLQLCDSATEFLMTTLEPDVRQQMRIISGDVGDILKRCRDQLAKDDYPILVAGETSSGKSTLLNAILGENILPTSLLATTSAICEIKYGTRKKAVFHLNEPDPVTGLKVLNMYLDGPAEEDLKTLSRYIHMRGNKLSRCSKVEIYWPLTMLEGGICIVDSPGLGESLLVDEQVSKYIPEVYALIYVINIANAGGLQQWNVAELLRALNRSGPEDCDNVLFVCNKWDQVPDYEKEEVKRHTLRRLKHQFPRLDETQLLWFSAKAKESAGYMADGLDKLLGGIESLLLRSLKHKLMVQHSLIWALIDQSGKIVRAILNNVMRGQEERKAKARVVSERLTKLQHLTDKVMKVLNEELDVKTSDAVQHLRSHLEVAETKTTIAHNALNEAPNITSIAECDLVREKTAKLVLRHARGLLLNEQYFQTIEASLIQMFKDKFTLLKETREHEFEEALGDDLTLLPTASLWDTESSIGDKDVKASKTSIFGIAVDVLSAFVSGPSIGMIALNKTIKKLASDKTFMKTYNEDKEAYIKDVTDKVVKHIRETDQLEAFVNERFQRPREYLSKLKNAIPKVAKADIQMIESLEGDARSQDVLLSLYSPQFDQCNALRGNLALFNLKHLRDIQYDLDELLASNPQKMGSGSFGSVYKVQVKTHGITKVAVLIIREFTHEADVAEFQDEEETLRYFESPHIVGYYGLASTAHSETDGLRFGLVMEYGPYLLESWLRAHKERTPAWWPDDEAKMTAGFNTVRDLASQLCNGLKAMHVKGFMHGDIKLDNIMVTEDGVLKITEVGRAKPPKRLIGAVPGTVLYAAPEMFSASGPYGTSADIYSLGFCLLEMWYGLRVTEDKYYLHKVVIKSQEFVSPPVQLQVPNTMSPCKGWVSLMKSCWKLDPKSRPSASDCVRMLSEMTL